MFFIVFILFFLEFFFIFSIFYLFKHILLTYLDWELLRVEVPCLVKQWVLDIAIAGVAPKRSVSETQPDFVVGGLVVFCHVALDVSRAVHFLADQAKPVLTSVLAIQTFQGRSGVLERLDKGKRISSKDLIDMRTLQLGLHCEA